MQGVEAEYRRHVGEFLVFYADGKGYEALFRRLRDTAAHAHYTQGSKGWLTMRHCFQGRAEAKPHVRLLARMRFSKLKRLVDFIAPS